MRAEDIVLAELRRRAEERGDRKVPLKVYITRGPDPCSEEELARQVLEALDSPSDPIDPSDIDGDLND